MCSMNSNSIAYFVPRLSCNFSFLIFNFFLVKLISIWALFHIVAQIWLIMNNRKKICDPKDSRPSILLLHKSNMVKLQNCADWGLSNLNFVKRSYFLSVHFLWCLYIRWKQLSHPDFRSPRIIFWCYQTSIVVSGIPDGLLCSLVVLLIGLVWNDHRGLSRKTFCVWSTLWIKRFPLSISPLCVIAIH